MKTFFRKLSWLARSKTKESELREELEFHVSEEVEGFRQKGLTDEEAKWAARRELGNVALIKEDTRSAWGWTLVEQFAQDLRYALRTMAGHPTFTLLAVISLGLGIGANTAIYSLMDAMLVRSLPVPHPESLVVLNWHAKPRTRNFVMHGMHGSTYKDDKLGETSGMFPYPAFEPFEKSDEIFSSVFAHFQTRFAPKLSIAVNGGAAVASGEYVSGEFFRGLGVAPAAGRVILSDDDRAGADSVAVVSYGLSEQYYGGPSKALGQSIRINNLAFAIVGVTPPEFFGVDPAISPDIYLPMHSNLKLGAIEAFGFHASEYRAPNEYWIQVMARLRPGVTLTQAEAVLAPAFHNWVATTAGNDAERANLPQLFLKEGAGGLDRLRRRYSKPLFVLLALVGLILALACANVANLLLARAAGRRREMALRLSVGASRLRIVHQLLTESVLLAALGGAFGVLFAIWGIRFLSVLVETGQKNSLNAELNWRVLLAAAALSLLTGILFGLAPAIESTRVDVIPALKETRAGQPGVRRAFRLLNARSLLVAGQIAIALLILVAAGLFVHTVTNLESVFLGFNRENLLLVPLNARQSGHGDADIARFYGELLERLRTIPGVRSATVAESSLIGPGTGLGVSAPGESRGDGEHVLSVGPDFFATMQIPILAGRDIQERDHAGSQAVAVVNERYAKAKFGDRNPLGQHLILWNRDKPARDMVIAGVVRDARYGDLRNELMPVVYFPYDQGYPKPDEMVYSLRTAGNPLAAAAAVREIVHQADLRLPVSGIETQAHEIDSDISEEITFARLSSAFAVLALIIACVGLYGTVSYGVARRTGEIGIRMALGAERGRIVKMVLGEVSLLMAAGLTAGIAAALGASRLVESFLYGVKHNDPVALSAAASALVAASLLAGYFPARRASRVDPMAALRSE